MSFTEGVPTVTIDLGGKPRVLGFTLGAMRRIKEIRGSLEMPENDDAAQLMAIPAYLWACMTEEDREEVTVEQIEDLIHPGNMHAISEQVRDLFESSTPKGAEGKGDPVPAKVRRAANRK